MTSRLCTFFKLFLCLGCFSTFFTQVITKIQVLRRRDEAIDGSPSGSYAPVYAACPEEFFIRNPHEGENKNILGQAETQYIKEKSAQSIPLWEEYLKNVDLQDFAIDEFLESAKNNGGLAAQTLPNIGFALSGGGGRALCYSGSILEAFDSRNAAANEAKIGGIVQLANYVAGVSGSSWLVGSWATSNFPQISSLIPNWQLSEDNEIWDWNIAKNYLSVYRTVREKEKAGFHVTIVDIWGRIISRHFINEPEKKDSQKGLRVLWSSIRETSAYKQRQAPFVMAVTTSRPGKGLSFSPESPSCKFSFKQKT